MNTRRMTMPTVVGLAFGLALSLSTIAPAQAGGFLERDSYEATYTDTFRACGTRIEVDGHAWGTFSIRDANQSTGGQFFYARDHYHLAETLTDLNTGRTYGTTASGVFRELQPRIVSDDGNIVEFITKNSGVYWTIRDDAGNVVLRDRGTITERYVFDTLGDSAPGGEFLDYELVSLKGQFPSWTDEGFCALWD